MQMPARTEVELDIFSGMPNPTWVLTPAEEESLARRLAVLPPTSPSEPSGRLGYRGLIVKPANGTETPLIRVQSGSVHITEGETTIHARDEGRELERWLIETGRPHVPENVFGVVEREVG
jgi:hypothetical protein